MKSFLAICAAALLLSFSQVAVAAGEGEKAKDKQAQEKQAQEKRVCKRVRVTGSRIREKVCRTQRDWDHLAEESQETLRKQRESRSVNTGGES